MKMVSGILYSSCFTAVVDVVAKVVLFVRVYNG
jgi:hypothetical protein